MKVRKKKRFLIGWLNSYLSFMERKEEEDISRALIEMGKLPAMEREELSKTLSEVANFLQSIARNLKEINDMRFLPIIMHQYLEYIIDSIIKSEFKHPDFIFKEHLFGFYEKCTLLRALGIFDGPAGKKLLTIVLRQSRYNSSN